MLGLLTPFPGCLAHIWCAHFDLTTRLILAAFRWSHGGMCFTVGCSGQPCSNGCLLPVGTCSSSGPLLNRYRSWLVFSEAGAGCPVDMHVWRGWRWRRPWLRPRRRGAAGTGTPRASVLEAVGGAGSLGRSMPQGANASVARTPEPAFEIQAIGPLSVEHLACACQAATFSKGHIRAVDNQNRPSTT